MNDIQVSKEKMFEDLVKQLEDCKIVRFRYITEEHSKLLWNVGEIIVRHPLFSHGEKMDLYETLSKRLSFSTRYLEAGVQVYQAFPFNTADEALEEAHKKLPNRVTISQRALIGLAGDSSIFATAAKTTDPLKGGIVLSCKEVAGFLNKFRGIRGYSENGEYEIYIFSDRDIVTMAEEKPILVAHIEDDKLIIDSEPNPEPSDELAERIDNIENDKNVEIVESKSTLIAKVPNKLAKSEPYLLAKWFYEFRKIPAEPTAIDMRNFKMLLNFYPINIIQGGIMWRLKHDPKGFWQGKITSAGVYRNFGNWMAESSIKTISFLEWIKQNPDYDYKKFKDKFARADNFMKAFIEAKKNPLVYFIDEDYGVYKEAIHIKTQEAKKETK